MSLKTGWSANATSFCDAGVKSLVAIIAALAFIGFLLNPTFTPAIYAIIVVYVIMLIIFAIWGRHRLLLSPEENYAVNGVHE